MRADSGARQLLQARTAIGRLAARIRSAERGLPFRPLALLIVAAFAALYAAGGLEPLDRALLGQRLSLITRPASGSLVIVELDARSIQALESWPWPRRYHARVIDRLLAAGAERIAIDIDFSARSTPDEDAALAAAVARAGPRLILPTFAQGASSRDRAMIAESAPNPALLQPTTEIGTVNVIAEPDGRIWRYAIGLDVAGVYRPSMAALLAGSGSYTSQSFHIDYSIRESSIATLSFIDVLEGRFDPALVADRRVIVGATAAELGDFAAVPVHGTLPGVFIQALAYESLVQRRTLSRSAATTTVVGLLILMSALCLATQRQRRSWRRNLLAAAALAVAILAAGILVQEFLALSLDTAAWLAALATWSLASLIRTLQAQSYRLLRRHRTAMRQRRMMRAIVETSFAGIIVVDERRRIAHANAAASRILGRQPGTMVGARIETVIATAAGAPPPSGEFEFRRDDGQRIFLELASRHLESAAGAADGAPPPATRMEVLSFRDVTERRNARVALEAALKEADSASRLKSEFLAAISHELRTPLNAILGFSEIIRDRGLGASLDRYVDYAGEIHVSGQRLAALVENLLDYALVLSGKLRLQLAATTLEACLQREIDACGAPAASAGVAVTLIEATSLAPRVLADRQRLRQIAGHLLSNAIKFTPKGGSVSVRILARPDAAGFEIRDTGIGMSAGEIERALQPLTQVDGRLERLHEGAGLGLSLALKLVELQGGTLAIVSTPGEGTCVQVWLPLAERERAAA